MGLIGVPEEDAEKYMILSVTDIRGNIYPGITCLLHENCLGRFSAAPEGDLLFFTEQSGTLRFRLSGITKNGK